MYTDGRPFISKNASDAVLKIQRHQKPKKSIKSIKIVEEKMLGLTG